MHGLQREAASNSELTRRHCRHHASLTEPGRLLMHQCSLRQMADTSKAAAACSWGHPDANGPLPEQSNGAAN